MDGLDPNQMPSCLHATPTSSTSSAALHTLRPLQPPTPTNTTTTTAPLQQTSSCRYKSSSSSSSTVSASCHGYSHTLQYFPDDSQPRPKPHTAFTMPDFGLGGGGAAVTSDSGDGGLVVGDRCRGLDGLDVGGSAGVAGEDGCGGRQKRCWKTANYEWMNIKRKVGQKGENFVFLLFFHSFWGRRGGLWFLKLNLNGTLIPYRQNSWSRNNWSKFANYNNRKQW